MILSFVVNILIFPSHSVFLIKFIVSIVNFLNQFIIYSLFKNIFFTTLLSLLKSAVIISNLSTSNLSISGFMLQSFL